MDRDRWLTPQELRAWRNFVSVVEVLSRTLDSELQRDAQLSHFEYYTLAMLSEAPEMTLRMTALAQLTNSTLPRLSHVISRLEARGYVKRSPCPEDRRATNAALTDHGWHKIVDTAPLHVRTVVTTVFDALHGRDVADLDRIMRRIADQLTRSTEPGAAPAGNTSS